MNHAEPCAYAACPEVATMTDDGYQFCHQHLLEHRADLHGEPWPSMRRGWYDKHVADLMRPSHGTAAAYKAHGRAGQKPCEKCKVGRIVREAPMGDRRASVMHHAARRSAA